MAHDATSAIEWYQWDGQSGGRGLTEAAVVHAQADRNPTEPHADGSLTVTFRQTGRSTHYRPATTDEAEEIRRENAARIAGNARLGQVVKDVLRTADLQMARWGQRMGSGVHVHVAGSQVVLFWWYSTEAERSTAPAPWIDGDGGVRAHVIEALEGAGLHYSNDGTDVVLTIEGNPSA